MRVAVISDIHGNIRALTAVLNDIERRSIDIVVNLGDCLSGPLQAADTADLLIEKNFLTVRGNHDRQLVDRPVEKMGASDSATFWTLKPHHLEWLRTFDATASLGHIRLTHGILSNDLIYCLETATDSGVRLATFPEIATRTRDVVEPVILCGHSHIQRIVMAQSGQIVVNPGSVGLQAYRDASPVDHVIENGSPHARYAVLQVAELSATVETYAVVYDWDAAADDAEAAGWFDWAHALRTGFCISTA